MAQEPLLHCRSMEQKASDGLAPAQQTGGRSQPFASRLSCGKSTPPGQDGGVTAGHCCAHVHDSTTHTPFVQLMFVVH